MKVTIVIFIACSMLFYAGLINAEGHCRANTGPGRCGKNAAPTPCGSVCEPRCGMPEPYCPKTCLRNGCACNEGYLRDEYTGQCVLRRCCTVPPR